MLPKANVCMHRHGPALRVFANMVLTISASVAVAGPLIEGKRAEPSPSAPATQIALPPPGMVPGFQSPSETKAKPVDVDAELAEIARNKRLMQTMLRQAPGAGEGKGAGKHAEGEPAAAAATARDTEKGQRPAADLGAGGVGELIGLSTASPRPASEAAHGAKAGGDVDEAELTRKRYAGSGGVANPSTGERSNYSKTDVDAFNQSLSAFLEQAKVWGLGVFAMAALLYAVTMWTTRKGRKERQQRLQIEPGADLRRLSPDRARGRSRSKRGRGSGRDGVVEPQSLRPGN